MARAGRVEIRDRMTDRHTPVVAGSIGGCPPERMPPSCAQGSRRDDARSCAARARASRVVRCIYVTGPAAVRPEGGTRATVKSDVQLYVVCAVSWRCIAKMEIRASLRVFFDEMSKGESVGCR